MSTPLIPQEIYLIERFTSLEQFEKARDLWADAVDHAETMLARFMRQLPPDYRSRPLPNQPDRVWGERVLPNFRDTLEGFNRGFIELTHGDLDALRWASGVSGDLRAQRADYPEDWMDEVQPGAADRFLELAAAAERHAKPIRITSQVGWSEGYLTRDYDTIVREPMNPPASWPTYRTDLKTRVSTGHRTPKTGIYLPDVGASAPNLLLKSDGPRGLAPDAPVAPIVLADGSRQHSVSTTWTLVERVAETGGGVPGATDDVQAGIRLRCEAGQACPRSGVWFTPARLGSRRHFTSGTPMPEIGGIYGATIWQWDEQQ